MRSLHTPIPSQQEHTVGLCKPPDCTIATIYWQASIFEGNQTQSEKSEPSFCSQCTPEQESLAFQVVINKEGHGVDLSLVFHSCNFARMVSCPGLGGCAAM
jgi:hypothetical protein